jgi:hypothetical protein
MQLDTDSLTGSGTELAIVFGFATGLGFAAGFGLATGLGFATGFSFATKRICNRIRIRNRIHFFSWSPTKAAWALGIPLRGGEVLFIDKTIILLLYQATVASVLRSQSRSHIFWSEPEPEP